MCSIRHCLRFDNVHRQRLFTKHNFPSFRRRDGDLGMEVVRSADIHNINIFSGHNGLPIGLRLFPSPLRRHCFYRGTFASAHHLEFEVMRQIEKMPNLYEGIGMSSPHESVTDHGDVEFSYLFGHVLLF